MTAAEDLAKKIASLINNQDVTSQNISGQSVKTTKRRYISENLPLVGTITITKKVPLSDAFIIGHPIQGELDNEDYIFDKGYDDTQDEVLLIKQG